MERKHALGGSPFVFSPAGTAPYRRFLPFDDELQEVSPDYVGPRVARRTH